VAKVVDCKEGHASIKIRGNTDDELIRNVQVHLQQYHPGLDMSGEQILAMASAQ
jgi:hypothetical protein